MGAVGGDERQGGEDGYSRRGRREVGIMQDLRMRAWIL